MAVKGIVNQRGEATLPLLVGNMNGQRQIIDRRHHEVHLQEPIHLS